MPYKPNPKTQCQHRSQLNRRCLLPIASDHPTLCANHARVQAKAESAERAKAVAADLLSGTETLATPSNVNHFLANLLTQFAHHRVTRRDATTFAYISQLLLNSQCVMHRQSQDAQAAQAAAEASQPQRIVIDMPRPNRGPLPNDSALRSGESLDSHSVDLHSADSHSVGSPSVDAHSVASLSVDSHSAASHSVPSPPPTSNRSPQPTTQPKNCHPARPDEGRERSAAPDEAIDSVRRREGSAFPVPDSGTNTRRPSAARTTNSPTPTRQQSPLPSHRPTAYPTTRPAPSPPPLPLHLLLPNQISNSPNHSQPPCTKSPSPVS